MFTSPGGALEMKEESASVRGMVASLRYRTAGLGVGRRVVAAIVRRECWRSCGRISRCRGQVGVAGTSRPFTDVYASNFEFQGATEQGIWTSALWTHISAVRKCIFAPLLETRVYGSFG